MCLQGAGPRPQSRQAFDTPRRASREPIPGRTQPGSLGLALMLKPFPVAGEDQRPLFIDRKALGVACRIRMSRRIVVAR